MLSISVHSSSTLLLNGVFRSTSQQDSITTPLLCSMVSSSDVSYQKSRKLAATTHNLEYALHHRFELSIILRASQRSFLALLVQNLCHTHVAQSENHLIDAYVPHCAMWMQRLVTLATSVEHMDDPPFLRIFSVSCSLPTAFDLLRTHASCVQLGRLSRVGGGCASYT